jgi:uncharacterized protein YoaH (UPF0181 family)
MSIASRQVRRWREAGSSVARVAHALVEQRRLDHDMIWPGQMGAREGFSRVRAAVVGHPQRLPELEPDRSLANEGALNGIQFLFTSKALSLSHEAQDKLIELVDGIGARAGSTGGKRLKWLAVSTLAQDLRRSRRYDPAFGRLVAEELRGKLPD